MIGKRFCKCRSDLLRYEHWAPIWPLAYTLGWEFLAHGRPEDRTDLVSIVLERIYAAMFCKECDVLYEDFQ
jgi:hypothetical protein